MSEKDLEAGLDARDGVLTDSATMTEKGAESSDRSSELRRVRDETSDEKPFKDGEDRPSSPVIEAQNEEDVIERMETQHSHHSARSKVSKILSAASSKRRKKEHLPRTVLPLSDLPNGVVGWESQDDPQMPLNFSPRQKWLTVCCLGAITFMTPFASTLLAPAITFLSNDFGNVGVTIASLAVTIYLLGYAIGPLLLSPLSEIYGRHIVLVLANVFFSLWLIGCALAPNIGALIVFRFLAGIGGSGCLTIGGGIISDMIPVDERGLAITVWMIGPLIGPSVGPICGAFVSETIGWRWGNWIVLIPSTVVIALLALVNKETNPRVLIQRKVMRLRKELGRDDLRSCYDDPSAARQSKAIILLNGLIRPIKMLILSPIILSLSVYIAFAYGVLYLLFNTIPLVFMGTYGWSLGITGLVYIALGSGYVIGQIIFTFISDSTVVRMTKANDGVYEPEMRLPDCIYFAGLLPVTFFWYGWATYYQTHWIVPILGLVPFGIGIIGIWQPIQAYIIDAYPMYAASALAAFTVFRSVIAAFLPLAGPQMYTALGLGWGNSLLGFIAFGLIPVPWLIYKFGGRLRKWQKLKL